MTRVKTERTIKTTSVTKWSAQALREALGLPAICRVYVVVNERCMGNGEQLDLGTDGVALFVEAEDITKETVEEEVEAKQKS